MDELISRQMPHSTEAEQAVLGSILIDERCIPKVIEKLRPEDFYLRQNREIFEAVCSMFNFSEPIDPVTLQEKMKQNGSYDEATTYDYIRQLMLVTLTAANVEEYISIVRDKSLLRRVADTAGGITDLVREGSATGADTLTAAEQRIYEIRKSEESGNQGWSPSPRWSCRSMTGSRSWPPTTRRCRGCPRAFPTWTTPSRASTPPT